MKKGFLILRPYLLRFRWLFVLGIVFVFMANLFSMWAPLFVGQVVNMIEKGQADRSVILTFIGLILSIAGLGECFRFLMRRILIDLSRDLEYEIRNDFFRKLQALDPHFFDSNNTGDLMSRATNDIDAVRMLLGPAVMYTANTIFGFPLKMALMLTMDWKLTVLSILPMAILPPMVKHFGAKTYKLSKLQQDSFGDLTTVVQENLAGIRVVKAYRQEAAQREKFLVGNDDYIKKSIDLATVQAVFFPSIRLVISCGMAMLLLVGGWRVMHNAMEVGTLLAFVLLFGSIIWPLIAAGWTVNLIQRGFASLERLGLVLHAVPSVVDPATPKVPKPFVPSVEFKNLTFQYDGTDRPQLRDIDLTIPAGHTLGIVGPVGSGKTTLIHLLARFYPVAPGMVSIGGQDVNAWSTEELRRRIGFVFQETFLFSDSIGWNIRFGASDDTPQEPVERVAKQAHVHGDIMGFPKGYMTVLGERGVNLSGGQKQRVSIARALLREADILVLDDSLSAVDTHTEESILTALKEVMAGKTTFLISHRISTVALADEIVVLEDGAITQRGTHEELIAQPGLYSELYRKQLTERAVEEYDEELAKEGSA